MAFPNLDGTGAFVVVVVGGRGVVAGRGLKLQPEDWLVEKRSKMSRVPSMARLGYVRLEEQEEQGT